MLRHLRKNQIIFLILILGDIAMFLLFTFLGKLEHQLNASLGDIFYTSFPFIMSWLGTIIFVVRLNVQQLYQFTYFIQNTTVAWLVAGPLAIVIRLLMEGRGTNLIFIFLVMTIVYLFIIIWRLLFYTCMVVICKR